MITLLSSLLNTSKTNNFILSFNIRKIQRTILILLNCINTYTTLLKRLHLFVSWLYDCKGNSQLCNWNIKIYSNLSNLVNITIALELVSQHILQKSSLVEWRGPLKKKILLFSLGKSDPIIASLFIFREFLPLEVKDLPVKLTKLYLSNNKFSLRIEPGDKVCVDEVASFLVISGLQLNTAVVVRQDVCKPVFGPVDR